ncbi:MAG TPA: hypothetical protein VFX92_10680 [Candidatus Krumholzibacteria bacterium]|nr:hypothetical protein [Candidatus Krumholzibacteria bacterium]
MLKRLMNRQTRCGVATVTILTFLPMVLSCDGSTQSVDSQHPRSSTTNGVSVVQVSKDTSNHLISASVNIAGQPHRVDLAPADWSVPVPGITATLETAEGATVAELSIGWRESTGEVWLVQAMNGNTLSMHFFERDGMITEEYDANGDKVILTHAVLEHEQLAKAAAKYQTGQLVLAPDVALRELGVPFSRLAGFATRHPEWTSENQPDWSALLAVMGDPTLANVVLGGDANPLRVDGLSRRTCLLLVLCATIGCIFLPIACIPCSGGVIACAIMEVVCWVIGCDCCF